MHIKNMPKLIYLLVVTCIGIVVRLDHERCYSLHNAFNNTEDVISLIGGT
jgi:hypothetical protein